MGLCPAPTQLSCSPPAPGAPESSGGLLKGETRLEGSCKASSGEGGVQPFLGGCSVLPNTTEAQTGRSVWHSPKQTGSPSPALVHTRSQPMVTVTVETTAQRLLLPPCQETVSPGVKHLDSEPSYPCLNPTLPNLCWAPLGKCLNLSLPLSPSL